MNDVKGRRKPNYKPISDYLEELHREIQKLSDKDLKKCP